MKREKFERMGTEICFNPIDNDPAHEVDGIAYTFEEIEQIKEALGY